ncbi:hypothetical protein ABZX30_19715 [Streptomyces sp. NPDC004542]|uniref:hypothetical protein n=1 Tax=Streptomyces sp. NPDC004542 TaxID=3154281 RepID=UPI0033BCF395
MSDGSPEQRDVPERGKRERIAGWAAIRLGARDRLRASMRGAFPDHWSFILGEMCLYSFLVLVVTGVYLTLYFHPRRH